jgi:hypothetical protein
MLAPSPESSPPSADRQIYSIIDDSDAFHAAMRRRVSELNISHLRLDEIAGLPAGYSGKLLGPAQVKNFGPMSFIVMPKSLGLCLALVEDPAALARVSGRYVSPRRRSAHYGNRARALGKRILERVRPEIIREFCKRAGKLAQECRTPEQRSRLGRKAARARWHGVRRKKAGRK